LNAEDAIPAHPIIAIQRLKPGPFNGIIDETLFEHQALYNGDLTRQYFLVAAFRGVAWPAISSQDAPKATRRKGFDCRSAHKKAE